MVTQYSIMPKKNTFILLTALYLVGTSLFVTGVSAKTIVKKTPTQMAYDKAVNYYNKNKIYRASAQMSDFFQQSLASGNTINFDQAFFASQVFLDTDKEYQARQVLLQVDYSALSKPFDQCRYLAIKAYDDFLQYNYNDAKTEADSAIAIDAKTCKASRARAHLVKYLTLFKEGDLAADDEYAAFIKEGSKLLGNDLVQYLLSNIDVIVAKYKNTPQGLIAVGDKYYLKGDANTAKKYYQKAIDKDADYLPAYVSMASIYELSNDYAKAISYYEKAEKIDPYYYEVQNNIGFDYYSIYDLNGDEQSAVLSIEHLEKAISYNPESYRSYNTLGVISYKKQDFESAINYYTKAIEYSSKIPNLAYSKPQANLGYIYYNEKKDFEKARQYFSDAIAIDKYNASALRGVARILYFVDGEPAKSLPYLLQASVYEPNSQDGARILALVYSDLGDYDDSLKYGLYYIKKDPSDLFMYDVVANDYTRLGMMNEANEILKLKSTINSNPTN